MEKSQRYHRCMVMAGGGFRFGIYLGMHTAAREHGQAPDILLASCGGAIAAALIQREPEPQAQQAWLQSRAMFGFWNSIRPGPGAAMHRALWGMARRALDQRPAPFIPDLYADYLFDTAAPLPLPLPLRAAPVAGPDVAVIGSRLLFSRAEVGQPRGLRKTLQETVFCPPRAAALLQSFAAPLGQAQWGHSAVAEQVATDCSMPLHDAVRSSVSDMYYFANHRHAQQHYSGGVVDLFPIEMAHRLAASVVMEFKAPFHQHTAVPAWRAVLGVDANARLRQVHAQAADVWIDSSDIGQALARQAMHKRLDCLRNRVLLRPASTYAEFVSHMQAHWAYGYQRAKEAFTRAAPAPLARMRLVNRFNLAVPWRS